MEKRNFDCKRLSKSFKGQWDFENGPMRVLLAQSEMDWSLFDAVWIAFEMIGLQNGSGHHSRFCQMGAI